MPSRNTYKALLLIIAVLLISNMVLLYLFVFTTSGTKAGNANRGTRESFATILKDSIGFSEQQIATYSELRSTERERLRVLFRQMRRIKSTFYKLTTPSVSESIVDNMADSIGITQKAIDLEMLQYFQKMRLLCTPDQLPAFDSTMSRFIVDRMIGRQSDRNRSNRPKVQSDKSNRSQP